MLRSVTGNNLVNQKDDADEVDPKQPVSVLDELENFWEKNDADKGIAKKGILAEHIMEKQMRDL